ISASKLHRLLPPRAPLPQRALFALVLFPTCGSFASTLARFCTRRGPVILCMEIELVSRYGSWSSSTIRTDASPRSSMLTYSPTLSTPTPSPLPADQSRDPPPLSSPPLPSLHLPPRSRGILVTSINFFSALIPESHLIA
ncbi:hypothetical protein L210DRAFT_937056, partial [Boletus edulis BED1]